MGSSYSAQKHPKKKFIYSSKEVLHLLDFFIFLSDILKKKKPTFLNLHSLKEFDKVCTTVMPITPLIRMTVVSISGIIGKTVMRIASATGIGYQSDSSMRFSNKLTYALNYYLVIK